MKLQPKIPILNRDLSWLSFNERVLQEASDPRNPLIERMRFVGIFSNNLDEKSIFPPLYERNSAPVAFLKAARSASIVLSICLSVRVLLLS